MNARGRLSLVKSAPAPNGNRHAGRPPRVLVVEDELLIRWSIVETLKASGHAVLEAEDAAGAMRVVRYGEEIDVVLLDYRLPDSNDLSLLIAIRHLMPEAAVVMMTAYGSPEIRSKALALGARRVIDKPFDMASLQAIVVDACERS